MKKIFFISLALIIILLITDFINKKLYNYNCQNATISQQIRECGAKMDISDIEKVFYYRKKISYITNGRDLMPYMELLFLENNQLKNFKKNYDWQLLDNKYKACMSQDADCLLSYIQTHELSEENLISLYENYLNSPSQCKEKFIYSNYFSLVKKLNIKNLYQNKNFIFCQ